MAQPQSNHAPHPAAVIADHNHRAPLRNTNSADGPSNPSGSPFYSKHPPGSQTHQSLESRRDGLFQLRPHTLSPYVQPIQQT